MKIAVCVKQVPDSWVEKKMDGQVLDRLGVDAVLNDLDEYALEEALRIVEANSPTGAAGPESGHEITLLCMGPERATEALRKGLSMGADSALLISDPALAGSDALSTSLVLAQVIASGGFDLVMCGTESTDARMSVIPAMLAERLGWAQLTHVHKLDIDLAGSTAQGARSTEIGVETISAHFPVVISVPDKINVPRYPSFKGIMGSKKKPLVIKALGEIEIEADSVGAPASWSTVREVTPRPPKSKGIKVVDTGDGGNQLVAFLEEQRVI